jgi:hypothetical protein|tara:strand:+ start:841 stop:1275 length:435 start_codon:yes stop_codon:yes gene_type:complete
MENKKIEILQVEAKKSQAGKTYWRVKTNEGWASCFLKTVADKLQEHLGSVIEVKLTETINGDYTNRVIQAFIKVSEGDVTKISEEVVVPKETKGLNSRDCSMYTSYAKDIYIAMLERSAKDSNSTKDLMEIAITLVKQAKEGFN